MNASIFLLALSAFLVSWAGSAAMRRYALARAMLDVPNSRSSHVIPTPRGGGVAFVLAFLLCLLALHLLGFLPLKLCVLHVLGGGLIALLGFRDDRQPLSSGVKLLVHLAVSAMAVIVLGGWAEFNAGWGVVPLGALGYALGALVLAWGINLYNFMDGIDGLAVSEAVFFSLAAVLVIVLAGGSAYEAVILASACMGFAFLNWPPAKLFMGDAGSGFLGFALTLIAFDSVSRMETTVWPWLILGGVFVVDTSFTLLRRMLTGQAWQEAHRSHAYQRAASRFGEHRAVTLFVQLINVFWLLPLALVAQYIPPFGWLFCLVALSPLLLACVFLGAGEPSAASAAQDEPLDLQSDLLGSEH